MIFHEELDKFVIVYIDDILVYSKMAEEDTRHLEVVLQKLRNNKLYANGEISEFGLMEMEFLEHVMTELEIKLENKNVEAIQKWKRLTTPK